MYIERGHLDEKDQAMDRGNSGTSVPTADDEPCLGHKLICKTADLAVDEATVPE